MCKPINIKRIAISAALGLAVVGCGGTTATLPPTYPVTGTVKYVGGEPVADGGIQFAPVDDPSFSVSGEIESDGRFTLYTVKGTTRVAGAPEGDYKATVQPPIPADHRAVPAIQLPQMFHFEPHENTFAIEVPPSKAK